MHMYENVTVSTVQVPSGLQILCSVLRGGGGGDTDNQWLSVYSCHHAARLILRLLRHVATVQIVARRHLHLASETVADRAVFRNIVYMRPLLVVCIVIYLSECAAVVHVCLRCLSW